MKRYRIDKLASNVLEAAVAAIDQGAPAHEESAGSWFESDPSTLATWLGCEDGGGVMLPRLLGAR